jgi:hypothetical protein
MLPRRKIRTMSLKCEHCDRPLIILETFCTDPYSHGMEWFRDIKKKCVCKSCGKEQEITVDTVKQDKWFK